VTLPSLDRPHLSSLAPFPGPAIGVDIGGSKMLAVRTGLGGEILAWQKRATPTKAQAVITAVLDLATEVAAGALGPVPMGVGCPGMIDRHGTAHFCPHLHALDGCDLREEIARGREVPGPTVVFNDATAACWAEHVAGAAQGYDDVLMVTLGTGIGGGAVVGGRLLEGSHGFAGEIGHMVIDPHGPPCPCGKVGCWERFASGNGLGRLAREAALAGQLDQLVARAGGDPEALRGEHVSAAAKEGDVEAVRVMGLFAWWVALGLANLANALDPSIIVLGGGLVEAGETVMRAVRQAFEELAEAPGARAVKIVPAHFGARAGAMGAALLALQAAATGA
jgi:glucokinase